MFQVIASTVEASGFPSASACMFFANIGAHLMRGSHGLDAVVKAGVCALRLSEQHDFNLTFGLIDRATRTAIPTGDRFHCWIECDGFIVDLMAPLYREMWQAATRSHEQLPRQMFQKPMQAMAADILAPRSRGDFYVFQDAACTSEMAGLVSEYSRLHPEFDIMRVCEAWYASTAAADAPSRTLEMRSGVRKEVELIHLQLSGDW